MKDLEVGQRIDIFQIQSNIYGNIWKQDGWYAESTNSDRFNNPDYISHAKYGRDMVCDNKYLSFIPHQNIINNFVKKGMVKVGTMVIKSIKR